MAISSIGSRSRAAVFIVATFTLSWSVWIATWLVIGRPATTSSPGMVAAVYVGSFAPGLVAACLSIASSPPQLRSWLRTFVAFRCGWRAYAAALLPLPLIILILTVAMGYVPRPAALHGRPEMLLYVTVFPVSIFNGLATAILGAGPLGEEGGWRGYLLPRLLETGGEMRASLVIGVVWALWHLPIMTMFADWRDGVPLLTYLPLYTAGVIGLSFVMSRVWLIGGGSLVPCIWLHGLVNAVGGVAFDRRMWISPWSAAAGTAHFAITTVLTALLLFAAARRRQRPSADQGLPDTGLSMRDSTEVWTHPAAAAIGDLSMAKGDV